MEFKVQNVTEFGKIWVNKSKVGLYTIRLRYGLVSVNNKAKNNCYWNLKSHELHLHSCSVSHLISISPFHLRYTHKLNISLNELKFSLTQKWRQKRINVLRPKAFIISSQSNNNNNSSLKHYSLGISQFSLLWSTLLAKNNIKGIDQILFDYILKDLILSCFNFINFNHFL